MRRPSRRFRSRQQNYRSTRPVVRNRMIAVETLEHRHVLTALTTPNPFFDPLDFDADTNGLPLLHSYSSGRGALYLDYSSFNLEGSSSTYSANEQDWIVTGHRYVSMMFSMFDLDVTTEKPLDKPFAWLTMNESGGGEAFLASFDFPNTSADGHANARDMHNLVHEFGHAMGLEHDSLYDTLGVSLDEYGPPLDDLHGMIMGGGNNSAPPLEKWNNWHTTVDVTSWQDDVAVIAAEIASEAGAGNGYRPDDHSPTLNFTATSLTSLGNNSWAATGVIETLSDVDTFKFAPTQSGYYSILLARDGASPVDLKLRVYTSGGSTLAAEDGDPKASPLTMVNDHHVTLWLDSGNTYYIQASSHGNYGDQGQYVVRADSLTPSIDNKWQTQDIGVNGVAGFSDYNSGTYTVAGSGWDIAGTDDGLHFMYMTLQGNGEIIARVTNVDGAGEWSQAGIMMRESLAADARNVAFAVTLDHGIQWTYRSVTGDIEHGGNPGNPYTWLRIVRTGTSGETFEYYAKQNSGDSWGTPFRTQTISGLTGTVYVGLYSSDARQEYIRNQLATVGTFGNVSIAANAGGVLNPDLAVNATTPPTVTVSATTPSAITLTWNNASEDGYIVERSTDRVNFVKVSGTVETGTFEDTGLSNGTTYWYAVRAQSDSGGTLAYSPRTNIISATTKPGGVTNLRLIASSTSSITIDWTDVNGETNYRIQRKTSTNGSWSTIATLPANTTIYTDTGLPSNARRWYRIQTLDSGGAQSAVVTPSPSSIYTRRTSNISGLTISGRTSDSLTLSWNTFSGASSYTIYRTVAPAVPWTYFSGHNVASQIATITPVSGSTQTFTDNEANNPDSDPLNPLDRVYYFVVANFASGGSTTPTDVGTVLAAVPSDVPLPSPWVVEDVGSVGGAGASKVYENEGYVTLIGTGVGIEGTSDSYHTARVPLTGNGAIDATIDSTTGGFAGIMIRESTAPGARFAFLGLSGGTGIWLRRTTTGGTPILSIAEEVQEGVMLELTRNSGNIRAYVSNDGGQNWTLLALQGFSGLSSTVQLELVYSSGNNGHLGGADFSNVSTTVTGPLIGGSGLMAMSGDSGGSSAMTGLVGLAGGSSSPAENGSAEMTVTAQAAGPVVAPRGRRVQRFSEVDWALLNMGREFRSKRTTEKLVDTVTGEPEASVEKCFSENSWWRLRD